MLTVPAWEEALPLFQLDPQQQHHHHYYASAYLNTLSGVLAPILAAISANGSAVQKIATDNVTAHSVAVDQNTGTLVVQPKAF